MATFFSMKSRGVVPHSTTRLAEVDAVLARQIDPMTLKKRLITLGSSYLTPDFRRNWRGSHRFAY